TSRPRHAAPGWHGDADAKNRKTRGGRPRGPVALLRPGELHDRRDAADRRRQARRHGPLRPTCGTARVINCISRSEPMAGLAERALAERQDFRWSDGEDQGFSDFVVKSSVARLEAPSSVPLAGPCSSEAL